MALECGAPDAAQETAMNLTEEFQRNAETIREQAVRSLFDLLNSICEGVVAVDRNARIAWISDRYAQRLGLPGKEAGIGRDVEDIIPASLMRQVVQTGEPILLDIMQFREDWFVVTRLPLKSGEGEVMGAIGFAWYDKLQYLKPLVSKFQRLQAELADAQRELAEHRRAKYNFSNFVGASPQCQEVKRQARRAAQREANVLLLGETGTGKELLAHAIHAASNRAGGPFVGVNVAAVPENLMESEFFGTAPGAYTGADRKGRDGKLKLAHGGTLFLDEVGEMPLAVQAKLLRALQEQEIEPLGSNKVIKVDARVIAATSRDLKELVAQGRFRSDLYYRLNVLPITLPPLRARLPDLPGLCEFLLEQISLRGGLPQREVSAEALELLAAHDWPGNIRELRNVLERATMLCDKHRLGAAEFAAILPAAAAKPRRAAGIPAVRPLNEAIAEAERTTIEAALLATQGQKAAAAHLLGISRATLYEKLAHLGIHA
jgi:transcriptional regulator with PAS, ATPase and Fis domain